MVIIVEGTKEAKKGLEEEDILPLLKNALNEGLKSKEAISKVAKDNNLPKNAVYDLYLKHFK
jgi:16S rRNA C1402 (ribose-2'-O) methylase RsmI